MDLTLPAISALAGLLFLGAVLYTSVGHAGASAYIAAMALFGVQPAVMRPTALALNIVVASFAAWRYVGAGLFHWRSTWPFLLGAVPAAFVGGALPVPGHLYRPMIGAVLLFAGLRLLWPGAPPETGEPRDVPIGIGIGAGAGIGLLSGLTGTGGGIFLSPLLLFMGWARPRTLSGIAVVFILGNSLAGLLGNWSSVRSLPAELPILAGAVLLGAILGTRLGIERFRVAGILRALGVVLLIAGLKLIGLY